MATKLNKPVRRETAKEYNRRPIIVTIAPCGAQSEALLGLRLKGTRTEYIMRISDVWIQAALQYGNRLKAAKREARKSGTPWRQAKKHFERQNRIVNFNKPQQTTDTE